MVADSPEEPPALRFFRVDLDRAATPVLRSVNWQVRAGQRWAVLGPNGGGKTTLMQLASGYLHPTRGTVDVLGRRLGRTDVRALRERLGTVSASVARMIVPWLPPGRWWFRPATAPWSPGGTPTARPTGPRRWPCWPPPASRASPTGPSASSPKESASRCSWPGRS